MLLSLFLSTWLIYSANVMITTLPNKCNSMETKGNLINFVTLAIIYIETGFSNKNKKKWKMKKSEKFFLIEQKILSGDSEHALSSHWNAHREIFSIENIIKSLLFEFILHVQFLDDTKIHISTISRWMMRMLFNAWYYAVFHFLLFYYQKMN